MEVFARLSPRFFSESGQERTILLHKSLLKNSLIQSKLRISQAQATRVHTLSPSQGRKQGQSLIDKGRRIAEKKAQLKQLYDQQFSTQLTLKPSISPKSQELVAARRRRYSFHWPPQQKRGLCEPALVFQPFQRSETRADLQTQNFSCAEASVSRERSQMYKTMIDKRKRISYGSPGFRI